MKPWFDIITRRDARLLKAWWSTHTLGSFSIQRSPTNPRFWCLTRS